MKHIGTQQIETERLILRRYTIDDAQAMYDNWASDEEVTRYLMWPAHSSVEVSAAVLKDWIPKYSHRDYYHWAIVLKEHGDDPIGDIAVVEQDDQVQRAHIGYCIGRKWWHKGITSEALQAVIGFLFDEVGFQRVESRHDPRNLHSGAVMRKCGMKFEGTLRQSDWNNQGICNADWYAILAADRKHRTVKQ